MAQNITLLGANYTAVPGVQLPKTGGGTALFTDVTPTTAAAADVAQGKIFFDASGSQQTGNGHDPIHGHRIPDHVLHRHQGRRICQRDGMVLFYATIRYRRMGDE